MHFHRVLRKSSIRKDYYKLELLILFLNGDIDNNSLKIVHLQELPLV
jgi:hypothetical protein